MPPKPKTFELRFPALGVIRRHSYERSYSATEYPTPWSMNCRQEDSLTNRLRGGSFTAQAAGTKSSPVYRDRAITFSSNVITAARQGDSTDTTLSRDVSDTSRPIIFQLALADVTGGTVVAVVPHKDMHLLCFTATETWVLSGDPATGALRRVSDKVGILGASAWCVNHDTVYFMSSRGLYSVSADGGSLTPISEEKVPSDLSGITDADCVLDYYHPDRGVYIHLTESPSWFYDSARDRLWPFDLTTTDSHVLVGPLRIGGPIQFGLIQTIHGIMAANSGTVNWRIVIGDSAEEAADNGKAAITAALAGSDYSSYVAASGTWSAGRSYAAWPRVRAAWALIWLSSSDTWAYESMLLETVQFGRWRG